MPIRNIRTQIRCDACGRLGWAHDLQFDSGGFFRQFPAGWWLEEIPPTKKRGVRYGVAVCSVDCATELDRRGVVTAWRNPQH